MRKALGATAVDIRRQFFVESAIISLVAAAQARLRRGHLHSAPPAPIAGLRPHPVISTPAVIASLVTLAAITLGAGTYPALRAAALTPWSASAPIKMA